MKKMYKPKIKMNENDDTIKKKGIKSLLVPTFLGDFHFSP